MKFKLLCLACSLFFFSCVPQSSQQKKQLNSYKSSQFTYYYQDPAWSSYVQKIDQELEKHLHDLGKIFPHMPKLELEVAVIKKTTAIQKFKLPEWIKAFYHRGRIFITITDSQPLRISLISKTLKHELTHAILGIWSQHRVPVWFDEGLALYLSSKPNKLKKYKPSNPKELKRNFAKHTHPKQAYHQSYYMIKYLFTIASKQGLNEYLKLLESNKEDAFETAFKISFQDFYRNFTHWLPIELNWKN